MSSIGSNLKGGWEKEGGERGGRGKLLESTRPDTVDGSFASRFRYNVHGTRGGAFGAGERKDDVDWYIESCVCIRTWININIFGCLCI